MVRSLNSCAFVGKVLADAPLRFDIELPIAIAPFQVPRIPLVEITITPKRTDDCFRNEILLKRSCHSTLLHALHSCCLLTKNAPNPFEFFTRELQVGPQLSGKRPKKKKKKKREEKKATRIRLKASCHPILLYALHSRHLTV